MHPNAINIKFEIDGPSELVEVSKKRGRGATGFVYREPERVYHEPLAISNAKKKDLMSLCRQGIIPRLFHDEYKAIPCDEDVRDCLDEPDEGENSDAADNE